MASIVIRKPKFLRDDHLMKQYVDIASIISNEACRPELTSAERYELLLKAGECLNNAAKAGGFFKTEDFFKWMDKQKH